MSTNFTASDISLEQERLWYLHHLYKQSNFLNCAIAMRITGEIDSETLNKSIVNIVERQQVLRSRFSFINDKIQCVLDDIKSNYLFIEKLPANCDKTCIESFINTNVNMPLSLTEGPLFKTLLASITKTEHIFLLVIHHIIADAKTLELFLHELVINYEGLIDNKLKSLPPLPVSFYEVVKNQTTLDEDSLEESKDFWTNKLADIKPLTNLPIAERDSQAYSANKHVFYLSPELTRKILSWCENNKISPNTVFLTAFQAVIARITEQYNFLIGLAIDHRVKTNSDNLMGYFAVPTIISNQILLDTPFLKGAQQTKQEVMTTLFYQDLPLAAISSVLKKNWPENNAPLIQLMFSYVGYMPIYQQGKYFNYEILTIERGGTDFDLFLTVVLGADNFILGLQYNNSLFQSAIIENLADMLETYLTQALINPQLNAAQLEIPALLLTEKNAKVKQSLSIAASFTAEALADVMNFWVNELKLPLNCEFSPYNQILSQLLIPNSLFFQKNTYGNILLLRFEDILKYHDSTSTDNSAEIINNYIAELISALIKAVQHSAKIFLVGICPSSLEFHNKYQALLNLEALENTFIQKITLPGIHTIKSNEWQQHYSVSKLFDPIADKLGHIPYTIEFYTSIATLIVRRLVNLTMPSIKVMVLDCDNTLWQGVVGEDGVNGIKLSEPYLFLQNFFIEQQQKGILLCLCSKNNEIDVLNVFNCRRDMPLKLSHISRYRINWNNKSHNLQALAAELNVGLDSFIFIDDNPLECAEVRQNCPQVLTLQLPTNPQAIPKFLQHLWLFDRANHTQEDLLRTEMYQQNLQREQYKTDLNDYSQFIANLNLQIQIVPLDSATLARASQLTQRTNQFNTTTLRRTDNELQTLCLTGRAKCCWLTTVEDRFGQYGIVGLVVAEPSQTSLKIDAMLLSCRVLGRGVEHKMLAHLGAFAETMGLKEIHIYYKKTQKNTPAENFLETLPFIHNTLVDDQTVYVLLTEHAKTINFDPKNYNDFSSASNIANQTIDQSSELIKNLIPYEYIANDLQDVNQITARIQAKSINKISPNDATPPRTENEKLLLPVWQEVLAVKKIGIHQNFFLLGGSSVQYVQLISKIVNLFNINVAFDKFLEVTTIHDMARLIEQLQSSPTLVSDEKATVINFKADIFLYDISNSAKLDIAVKPQTILLTGATGFLGAYLLRDLLLQTNATIYCLVRADSDEKAIDRIHKNLLAYGLWQSNFHARIKIILGDLAKPYFDLSETHYQQLTQNIECIYHNGALVNFISPYAALKETNVTSTREVIRLAASYRKKPVHYISSIGIFDSREFLNAGCITEEQMPVSASSLSTGYFQSKWVAEKIIMLAREQGIPAAIYRPGNITGDTKTGITTTDDLFFRMLKTSLDLNLFPDIEVESVPVNYVSQAIVAVSQTATTKNYHIVNPNRLSVSEYVKWANSQGMQLQLLSLTNWIDKILAIVKQDTQSLLYPFLPMLQTKNFFEIASQRPCFDNSNTLVALHNTAVSLPTFDSNLFNVYTAFFKNFASREKLLEVN